MQVNTEEKKLIEGIVSKDENSFKIFVEKYQTFVLNVCFKFVQDFDDAQDLAQEVFIKVYDSASSFRGEAKISTWLYRISANKSLNYIRSKRKFSFLDRLNSLLNEDGEIQSKATFNATDESTEDLKSNYIYQAIAELSDKQRVAFTLNKLENLSYKEISDVMQLSLSSIESLIHRAKLNLQKSLYVKFKKLN
ncbi:MAG: RNA polymerase sigma factor [Bacteroidetes bacterium]|nr:RNA polymerase sigma factor [Bacteroidota bacterium]MBT5530174.1 RNA polymerase sigma factor [Cytophagia bacterium]MBT7038817.1 RNA polymerase sigma factor [Bacteroidota bacterium]MBT7827571.1 RNA polymerase sigma factor [Bacteroidota bacterium]